MSRSYFARLTPRNPTSLKAVEELVSFYSNKYVISQEEATRVHFHICMWCDKGIENLRYHLKSKIDSQIYLSGKDIEDKVSAIAYTIKDGYYVHRGLDVNEFLLANAVTRPKVDFDDTIKRITDDYDPSYVSDQKLLTQIIDTYIQCRRKPYKQHIRALYDSIKISKDQTYKQRLIENILSNS